MFLLVKIKRLALQRYEILQRRRQIAQHAGMGWQADRLQHSVAAQAAVIVLCLFLDQVLQVFPLLGGRLQLLEEHGHQAVTLGDIAAVAVDHLQVGLHGDFDILMRGGVS